VPTSTSDPAPDARIALSAGRYAPRGAPGTTAASADEGSHSLHIDDFGVHVVALGTALPPWAEPTVVPLRSDDVELVILSSDDAVCAAWNRFMRGRPTAPALQLIVHTEDDPGARIARDCRCATLEVSVRPRDRDTVAHALAACAHGGELLIGTHAADLRTVTGVDAGQVVRGRAIVVDVLGDAGTATIARDAIGRLTAVGHNGGRLMFQFVGQRDAAAFSLIALDACATAIIADDAGGDWILSCSFSDRTALVLVAFRRPALIASTGAPIGAVNQEAC
jgi:hypothetical protein